MSTLRQLIPAACALVALAGCGQSNALPASATYSSGAMLQGMPQMPTSGMPGAMPQGAYGMPGYGQPGYGQPANGQMMAGAQPGANQAMQSGLQLKNVLMQAVSMHQGLKATLSTYSQGHYKQGQYQSDLQTGTTVATVTWHRANELRADVISTTRSYLNGAAMATTDGQNITARAAGLLGLIPFHLQANDPKLSNARNHPFTQNNPNTQFQRLTSQAAVWTWVGQDVENGVTVQLCRVDNVPRLDNEITSEVVAIDPQVGSLRRLIMYSGQTKVLDDNFTTWQWDPQVDSSTFSL